jgi:hypothetical protein
MRRAAAAAALLLPPAAALAQGQPSQSSQWVNDLLQGCWACGAFNTVSAIGLGFADLVFDQLSGGMTLLIGLFMALWILLFAARMFLPFGPEHGRSQWNEGASKLFRLLLVLAFLQGSGPFWNYVFIPLISAGMGVASQMATATDQYEANFGKTESQPNGSVDYCGGQVPLTVQQGLSANSQSAAQAMTQMDCPLSRIQSQFGKGMLIGVAVMSQGTCINVWAKNSLAQAIEYLIAGAVMAGVFLFGYIVFPLLLVDVVMRVSLVAATAPLLISATLFRATIGMARRALWSLVQCALTLMFGAAIAGIGKATMAYILSQLPVSSGQSLTDWSSLTNALENPCSAGLSIGFFTAGYYMLIGTAIIVIFMMRRAGSLAAEITNIASDGVGAQAGVAFIAGKAAQATGRAAQWAARALTSRDKARAVTGNLPK